MTDHNCSGDTCEVCKLARLVDRLLARIEELKVALSTVADQLDNWDGVQGCDGEKGCDCFVCTAYHAAQAALKGDK